MKIQINGEMKETPSATVETLLKELNFLPAQVAVEHNGIVLFHHELAQTHLREGDCIEIVRVVAGG